jgi:secreted PhoX family phosphatase
MVDNTRSQEELTRRTFLAGGATTGLGIALSGSVGSVFAASPARGAVQKAATGAEPGYGPLIPDPQGLLALPAGFSYKLIAQTGVTTLESGEVTPDRTDGTASFVRHGGNGSVLVVNHEIGAQANPIIVPHLAGLTYDAGRAFGGTTNLEVDKDGNRVREYVSLAGTFINCAGGKTPWHTWLTCEETEAIPTPTNGLLKRHGYVFEVDPYDQDANRDPKPLRFLGRFAHEAVAVDPETHVIYETEDATGPHGLFYRWTPPDSALPLEKGSLRALPESAGTLEAMRASIGGTFVPDLSVATEPGTTYDVTWVAVLERDATAQPLRVQVTTATRSRKLEGCWWGDGGAYVVASFARTTDGSAAQHDGQVWFFDPLSQTLTLKLWFALTPNRNVDVDGPDNITISPYGSVILAEDGAGQQHIVGATDTGETFFFALNQLNNSEFAGPTFSQNKKTLFVNIYNPGHVFAVTGPWRKH